MSIHMTNARAAYGDQMPAWIGVLANACDQSGLKKVAVKVGRDSSVLSLVLNAKYPGNVERIERAVRGALMAETVDCPVLSTIPTSDCEKHQRASFSSASPQAVKLSRQCPSCPKGGQYAE